MHVAPVVLEGEAVRLEPLELRHAVDLAVAGAEPEIWAYLPCGPVLGVEAMQHWIAERLAQDATGGSLGFAIVARTTGRAVGSTSYLDIARGDRRLEIGATWLGREVRRTRVNTECKRLLLGHAFEQLGVGRVQLKTDARNLRSQLAIERLGAQREGVLRAHMVLWDGFVRDTVMYSIIAAEWPAVKARLEAMLAGRVSSGS
jgi:RimJ/RimL family protein N-acetyltransferase